MNVHCLHPEALMVTAAARRESELSVIHCRFLGAILDVSLGKVDLGDDPLAKLFQVELGIGVEVKAADYSYNALVASGDPHLAEVPLKVFVVDVLVVPIVDLQEEPLEVKVVPRIQLLLNLFLPLGQLDFFVDQLGKGSLDVKGEEFLLSDRIGGSLGCDGSQVGLVAWKEHLEITSR